MTIYYVSPNGVTAWPNNTDVDHPAEASAAHKEFLGAVAGDTVYFLSGTYNTGDAADWEHPAWTPRNSGSSGYPITFQCYSGPCNINQGSGPAFGTYGQNYIIWDGFKATKTDTSNASALTRFSNSDHCIIQNCDFTGNGSTSSINTLIMANGTTYLTVRNNKLHHSMGPDTTNSTGLMTYNCNNGLIEYNEFYNNRVGYRDKVNGTNNTVRYNFFHSGGGYWLDGSNAGNPHHIYVYQNVFLNGGEHQIHVYLDSFSASYIYIYNNTIYNGGDAIMTEGQAVNVIEVFNNIIHTATRGIRLYSTTTNRYSDYNDVYNSTYFGSLGANDYSLANWRTALGGCPGTGRECNGITSNPNFVNAGGNLVTDYKRTSYPTDGRGGSYSDVMGAYITGSETIGIEEEGSASVSPSGSPSLSPSASVSPSESPSRSPSLSPSKSPSASPSRSPSRSPSASPSKSPSSSPSVSPSSSPSLSPSMGGEYARFVLVDSTYIAASGENTTGQLTAPQYKTTDFFTAGRIQDDELTTDIVGMNTSLGDTEYCVNGNMEADSNWTSVNVPDTNERSNVQVHGDSYSRHVVDTTPSYAGIRSDTFTSTTGRVYRVSGYYYVVTSGIMRVVFTRGVDGMGQNIAWVSVPNTWTYFTAEYTETNGGNNASVAFVNNSGSTAIEFYVDDISVKEVINKYTEIEWCIEATDYAVEGDTYEFRVTKGTG